ncbi:4-(cytidine 5'-diphospho)-2-C-methyl-D-erythritol kinase [Hathewaya histolytica]|uniref:4-diphosphocytidyl-2-C-methyl-D-erythritol kinase n=1 Tax=Hathewaya histolytica TaxID=1498 RepID=A0A4U9RRL3_HATHI|nr:4-(cytidine 5'-diphospho)-2-C-methyl-D-erythritol kinase [Hathewaya histolytica]VTQ94251.1 4-diphosphocytidyl-2-C-methyl-D-erythritol kinase [Hathewaya histolytica]
MQKKAYAKVNLSLDVVGKREDDYHLLKMIMQQIDLYDIIDINENKEKEIKVFCNKPFVPLDNRNLAYKAAEAFIEKYNIGVGVDIKIQKNIPVSAGLAGGSTDAAAVLSLMREIFKKHISMDEIMKLGLEIGADVPYCIQGGTALCEGIGEKINPLKPFRNYILVLVKPNFGVSTKDIYKSLNINKIYKHPNTEAIIKAMENEDLRFVGSNMKNVLENVTVSVYPTISNIKKNMMNLGAVGSLMSGSGPTVFGLFEDMLKAQRAYEYFKCTYNDVFITRTL